MLWITLRAGLAADAHAGGNHLPPGGLKENHSCWGTRAWIELPVSAACESPAKRPEIGCGVQCLPPFRARGAAAPYSLSGSDRPLSVCNIRNADGSSRSTSAVVFE